MREDTGGFHYRFIVVGGVTLCAMRIAYWIALALGIALILYVVVFGFMVLVTRLSSPWPMDCKPIGLIGVGCGSPENLGFLYEATLGIRALVGGFLIWAFFRHRRDGRIGA